MSIELAELRDAAQKAFPADQLTPARDASWQSMVDMGWLLLEVPEDMDGLGLGRDAAAAIHFEMGCVLSTAPLLPAMLALQAVTASPLLTNKIDWIERLCGGEYVPLNMLPAALDTDADGSVTGSVQGLFDADMASHVLVGASDFYALVPVGAPGVALTEQPLWDQSRRLFTLDLQGYTPDPSLILAKGVTATELHNHISINAQTGLAADCLGAAGAILEMSVEYLKTRRQFDRPLAMFQALKHRVADMKVKLTAAEALLWSQVSGDTTALRAGALKAHAANTFRDIAEEAIQLHGGIGLTEEHPCHLFFKRAFLNCQLCGSVDHWEEQAGRAAL